MYRYFQHVLAEKRKKNIFLILKRTQLNNNNAINWQQTLYTSREYRGIGIQGVAVGLRSLL